MNYITELMWWQWISIAVGMIVGLICVYSIIDYNTKIISLRVVNVVLCVFGMMFCGYAFLCFGVWANLIKPIYNMMTYMVQTIF